MSWIWIFVIGILILGLIIGVILYIVYRNRKVEDIRSVPDRGDILASTTTVERPIPIVLEPVENVPIEENLEPVPIQRDYRPYKVVGARDGSWFQVLDRQGDIVASFSTPTSEDETPTFEAECPQGQVELVGIHSTPEGERLGPVGCASDADGTPQIQYVGQNENIERLYSLGRILPMSENTSTGCPSGFQRLMETDGITGLRNGITMPILSRGMRYICVPDDQCKFHRDCPDGQICSGGQCIPVEQISDF